MSKYCVKCLKQNNKVKSFKNTRLCEFHRMERLNYKDTHLLPLKSYWRRIYGSCYNSAWQLYSVYGARGFTMCEEWKKSPNRFYEWALSQGYEKGKSIKLKKGLKEYNPENCFILEE